MTDHNIPGESFVIPDEFGPYRYVRIIGKGAFSVVVLAEHHVSKSQFACKICQRDDFVDRSILEQFNRELSVLQTVYHPNIVHLHDIIYSDNLVIIVTEYCECGDLLSMMLNEKISNEIAARKYFIDILEGVSYIHSREISHRDIKLENIFVDSNGTAKLGDFGLCHHTAGGLLKTHCGSPLYVAPEIVEAKPYDGKALDIWSLGVVLFMITTGTSPWESKNVDKMYQEILECKVNIPFYLTPSLVDLLGSMLQKDPQMRPKADEILLHPWVIGSTHLQKRSIRVHNSAPHFSIPHRLIKKRRMSAGCEPLTLPTRFRRRRSRIQRSNSIGNRFNIDSKCFKEPDSSLLVC